MSRLRASAEIVLERDQRLDHELVRLAHRDALGRRALGVLAQRFLQMRGYDRLGFVRTNDYSRERLGWSNRQLEEVARVARCFASLPVLDRALARGDINWSKARLLCGLVTSENECAWLEIARRLDVSDLVERVKSARTARSELRTSDAMAAAGAGTLDGSGGSPPGADAAGETATLDDLEDRVDGEEWARFRMQCPRRVRLLWNDTVKQARLMAGKPLAPWRAADLIAAEASSGSAPHADAWQQEPWCSLGEPSVSCSHVNAGSQAHVGGRTSSSFDGEEGCSWADDGVQTVRTGFGPTTGERSGCDHNEGILGGHGAGHVPSSASSSGASGAADTGADCTAGPEVASTDAVLASGTGGATEAGASGPNAASIDDVLALDPFRRRIGGAESMDARALDAAMRSVRRAMQRADADLGRALGAFFDLRLHVKLGYGTRTDYARERLGMSPRTARALVAVERGAVRASIALMRSYRRGDLSWLQVLILLAVVTPRNAKAWIARASEVTLRRLTDEVEWVIEQVDIDSEANAEKLPPPPDHVLRQPKRQIRAEGEGAGASPNDVVDGILGRVRISMFGPLSIISLFRATMQGFHAPDEPHWRGLERMLMAVMHEWTSQPRHRNPVYERDGHRCTTPCCNSMSNLEDHHIVFRSAGGTDDLWNRTVVCFAHHRHAIHKGRVRATGKAPDGITWELGVAPGRAPFMRLAGDRYLERTVG